jgi:hypothetical protein
MDHPEGVRLGRPRDLQSKGPEPFAPARFGFRVVILSGCGICLLAALLEATEVLERQKRVSSRESHGHRELSRAQKFKRLLAQQKVRAATKRRVSLRLCSNPN